MKPRTGVSFFRNKKTDQFVVQIRYQGNRFYEAFPAGQEQEALLRKKALELEMQRLKPGQTPSFIVKKASRKINPDGTPKTTDPLLKQPIEKIWKFFEQTKKARLAQKTLATYLCAWNSFKKHTDCVQIGDIKSLSVNNDTLAKHGECTCDLQ
ncbi:MAG TPA: hypothetical protein ENN29_11835 [Candidatus Hydrogenedentes bacterium]|nr:hypothetical protein [Candidatus Hydrogenedentota bacterium]